jgi:transcriptional regulator with XRE-family HTH domain
MGQKTLKNPIDEHVGSRVRTRRLMLDMSQQTLGEAVGVAYQQIQKYETGANRIGASRMQQFSNILQVPVSFFFDGLPNPKATGHSPPPHVLSPDDITRFMATREGLDLARAFMQIANIQLRRRIVNLVADIGGIES